MIVYDAFKVFGMAALLILIIIYLLFSIIRRVTELRKNREERINEKLQEKYNKEVSEISNITKEEAIKKLKENCCVMCAYGSQNNRDAIRTLEQELNKSEDPDLTNEEKFFKDWGKRPFYNDRVDYFCPAEIAPLLVSQYDAEFISKGCIGLDLDLSDPNRCKNCKKRFWKSKYKRPEKKEVR